MHDLPLVGLCYALGDRLEIADYRESADRYVREFLRRCTHFPTGLFPWGEHAFWDLQHDHLGNSCAPGPAWHDHLRQAPPWLWKKVAHFSPETLQRFADGLDWHWVTEAREEYNRHAALSECFRAQPLARSCDFPRHSGFYILDLACALADQPREKLRLDLMRFADYWWARRVDGECLPIESRTPISEHEFYGIRSTSQTLSLGLSLLEAAESLPPGERDLAAVLQARGTHYCQCFLNAPHQIEQRLFVSGYDAETRQPRSTYPLYGSVYGIFPAAQAALLCCAAFRRLADLRFLAWAQAVARTLVALDWAESPDSQEFVYQGRKSTPNVAPALDAGLTLELIADLYDITKERVWLDCGIEVWQRVHRRYFKAGLVALASDGEWYEAQQGSAYLLHGAARFGLFLHSEISIPPDYSAR